MASSLTYQRLRAPKGDGELLLVPSWEDCKSLPQYNRDLLVRCDFELHGKSFEQLRTDAREDLLTLASRYTHGYATQVPSTNTAQLVVMSGHQPQLFHPGVWAKNFFAARLADAVSGIAIHVIIDNDALREHAIRVPTGNLKSPEIALESFDRYAEPQPYECRRAKDPTLLRSFAERVDARLTGIVEEPIVKTLWPAVNRAVQEGKPLGHAFAQARHELERSWGLHTLEVPLSWLCNTEAFRWFAAYLLWRGDDVHRHYNQRLAEYRSVHGVRSPAQPLPDLQSDGEWSEAPFWVWDDQNSDRRALWARKQGPDIHLRVSASRSWTLSAAGHNAKAACDQLSSLESRGIYLRPRALTNTMFLRLFLSDCFVHGIGGAKYDQLTDLLIQDLFGNAPPKFIGFSQTTLLPVSVKTASDTKISHKRQHLREMYFHPENFLDANTRNNDQVSMLEKTKIKWTRMELPRGERAERHRQIEAANVALREHLQEKAAIEKKQLLELESLLPAYRVWSSREWSFCLFPEAFLKTRLLDLDFAST